ncbi:recombinase family protein [Saccharibacillus sp. JS10]|uniref:recombinase family protein n=1 Tax=Saccharibacillus sp. JS10 TaxID=2950552 RepID=UPI00210A176D|nr:recombinase family protein [Saccharibacillus sp. JS10]MCQ4086442.1 recombinase family protein [Saccharibacillus sp. JS10]
MIIGYMRPSQDDPNCENQNQLLKRKSCDRILKEEHSSAKQRIQFDKLMNTVEAGDILVVTRLFSLADSMKHLADLLKKLEQKKVNLYSLNENINTQDGSGYHFLEHVKALLDLQADLTSEQTKKGMDEAKEKGTKLGRPRKLDANVMKAIQMYESKEFSIAEIREKTGISKTTLYRYLGS